MANKRKSPSFFSFLIAGIIFLSSIIVLILPHLIPPPLTSLTTPTPDTILWQTYSNPKYEFSLQYPPDWTQSVGGNNSFYFWPEESQGKTYLSVSVRDKPDQIHDSYARYITSIHGDDFYYFFSSNLNPNPQHRLVYNQIISTFKYSRTDISAVMKLSLPPGLEIDQLEMPEQIGDVYFVRFLKGNMNLPIDSSVRRSGVLLTTENNSAWKIFYEIIDIRYSNNPYSFWREGNNYYSVIVDTNGAGSGEGIGKLISINSQTKEWKVVDCFYYSPESYGQFTSSLPKNELLSERVKAYTDPTVTRYNSDYVFNPGLNKFTINSRVEDNCTAFKLIFP